MSLDLHGPHAVESSIVIQATIERRGLYHAFVWRLFSKGFSQKTYSSRISRLNVVLPQDIDLRLLLRNNLKARLSVKITFKQIKITLAIVIFRVFYSVLSERS